MTEHECIRCHKTFPEDQMKQDYDPYEKEVNETLVDFGWRCNQCHQDLIDDT